MTKRNRKQNQTTKSEKQGRGALLAKRLSCLSLWLCKWGRAFLQLLGRIARTLWSKFLCRFFKRIVLPAVAVLILIGMLSGVTVLILSAAVCNKTEERILSAEAIAAMPGEFDCILVLGCRVYANGEPSPMLYDRIKTGCALYESGVGDKLLMSGDNQDVYYNEVASMRREAVALGIPEDAILCDRYGLSTYDSVVRALEEYGYRRVVIVTQSYHLYRALYVAEKLGIEAYGVSADLRPYYGQTKRDLREILARCKDVVYTHKRLPTTRQAQLAEGQPTSPD